MGTATETIRAELMARLDAQDATVAHSNNGRLSTAQTLGALVNVRARCTGHEVNLRTPFTPSLASGLIPVMLEPMHYVDPGRRPVAAAKQARYSATSGLGLPHLVLGVVHHAFRMHVVAARDWVEE